MAHFHLPAETEIGLRQHYDNFLLERQFVHNLSPASLAGYRWAWVAFEPALSQQDGGFSTLKPAIVQQIGALRERGLSPVSINTHLRALNAFFRWLHTEGHADRLLTIPKLKEPEKLLPTLTRQQVKRLVACRPKGRCEQQVQLIACLILDTGLRIDEALSLDRDTDVDLDNLLLKVRDGKGGKGRVVPFSRQLRKRLYKHLRSRTPRFSSLLFYAADGEKIHQRNALRAFKKICHRSGVAGVRTSFHTLRHTFATLYLKNGGDVFRLQRILGHSKLEMTRRYVQLQTDDLRDVHDRLSPLNE